MLLTVPLMAVLLMHEYEANGRFGSQTAKIDTITSVILESLFRLKLFFYGPTAIFKNVSLVD